MIHHLPPLLNQHCVSTHPAAFHTTVLTHPPSRARGASDVPCVPPVFHMTHPAERRRSWATAHVSTAWQIYYHEQLKRVEQKRSGHHEKSPPTVTRPDSERHKDLPTDAGKRGQQPVTSPSSAVTLDPAHLHSVERRRRCKPATFEPVRRLRQKVLEHPYLKSQAPLQDAPCRLCDPFAQVPWLESSGHLRGFGRLVPDSCSAAQLLSPRHSLPPSYHHHTFLSPGLLASGHQES
ncbi:uncharacterized protein ACB058_010191 isoform 2-T2 [Synchiropus picturatus]